MKIFIVVILFISMYQHARCAYTFNEIMKDFTNVAKVSYDLLKDITTNIGKKVSSFFSGWLGLKKIGQSSDSDEDATTFSKFVNIKWASGDGEKPVADTFRSESEVQLTTPELALWHGRKMESHSVQTQDGYFLTLHRLKTYHVMTSRTVLLHHGLLGSSTDWILPGPQNSLPYILADAGYDVWIANARGNYYSRGHASMTIDYPEYWSFSWQEIGQFDLPAIIDYIRMEKHTNETINYIGHSMGATALLVLLSTAPQFNDYLRMGILLAPLAFMSDVKGPLKTLTSTPNNIFRTMSSGEFLPNRKVPSWLATKYCKGPRGFCSNPLFFLSGFNQYHKWNASFIARLLYYLPAGGSINTIFHYIQLAQSGKFHKYDDELSEFELNKIALPMALFSSSDDWLASVPDVLKLYFCIQNPIDHYIIRGQNVTHTDFVFGPEVSSLVFKKVLEYLEDGLTWNMMQINEV